MACVHVIGIRLLLHLSTIDRIVPLVDRSLWIAVATA